VLVDDSALPLDFVARREVEDSAETPFDAVIDVRRLVGHEIAVLEQEWLVPFVGVVITSR
jgi:hypothetical protein